MAFSFLLGDPAFLRWRIMAESWQAVAACRADDRRRPAFRGRCLVFPGRFLRFRYGSRTMRRPRVRAHMNACGTHFSHPIAVADEKGCRRARSL
jgi:hypothetical protein